MTNEQWVKSQGIFIQDIHIATEDFWGATNVFVIWCDSTRGKILKRYEFTDYGLPKDRAYWLWKWMKEERID